MACSSLFIKGTKNSTLNNTTNVTNLIFLLYLTEFLLIYVIIKL